jgi:hypothetical protein
VPPNRPRCWRDPNLGGDPLTLPYPYPYPYPYPFPFPIGMEHARAGEPARGRSAWHLLPRRTDTKSRRSHRFSQMSPATPATSATSAASAAAGASVVPAADGALPTPTLSLFNACERSSRCRSSLPAHAADVAGVAGLTSDMSPPFARIWGSQAVTWRRIESFLRWTRYPVTYMQHNQLWRSEPCPMISVPQGIEPLHPQKKALKKGLLQGLSGFRARKPRSAAD